MPNRLYVLIPLLLVLTCAGCARRGSRPVRGEVVEAQGSRSVTVRMESTRGLEPGAVLKVSREEGGELRYLGFIVVTRIEGLTVVCQGDNDSERLRPGDRVLGVVPD